MNVHHLKPIHVHKNIKEHVIQLTIYKILCYQNINYINHNLKEVLYHIIYLKCQLLV
jgi:hypothetical protein